MKNSPTPPEDRRLEPSAAWREALVLFDSDLRRRGAAEQTRRAYGVDLGQFALWGTSQGLDPAEVTPRALRRYAAALSETNAVPTTLARKLASLRAFYRALREHGLDAARAARPGAVRDRLRQRPAGRGARHARRRVRRLRRRGAARRGQGPEDPDRAGRGALAARAGALPRARAAGARDRRR